MTNKFSLVLGSVVGSLIMIGCSDDKTPDEQSSSTWLETYMLPLGIEAPGFRCCRDFEQVLKTWEHAQWYGKAPHRLALKMPFPYATTSMQKFNQEIFPRILRERSELHSLTSTGTSVEQPARKN